MISKDYAAIVNGFFHAMGGVRLRTIRTETYLNQAEAAGLRRK